MNFIKRMQEINARKAELRSMLQGTDEVNLDEIEKELRELDTEYQALEKRKVVGKSAFLRCHIFRFHLI